MTLAEMSAKVKLQLRDISGAQWSPTEVIDAINDGYREFAEMTKCLVKHAEIKISNNTRTFSVPTDCILIDRFEWDGKALPIISTPVMDANYGTNWRNAVGSSIKAIVKDSEGFDSLRIYPYLDDDDTGHINTDNYVEGTNASIYRCIKDHTSAAATRPITGADYLDYWEVTTVSTTASAWVTGTDYELYLPLKIDYTYLPTDLALTGGADEPDMPAQYHMALVNYAKYILLELNVKSDQNIALSNRFYDNFIMYVKRAKHNKIKGYASQRSQRVISRSFV